MAETEEFGYVLGLIDKMSGPAKDGASALDKLQGQIAGTEKALRKLTVQQLKYKEAGQGGIAGQLGVEISKAKLHLGDLHKGLGEASAAERKTASDAAAAGRETEKAARMAAAANKKAASDAAAADREAARAAKEHADARAHLASQIGAVGLAVGAAALAIAAKGAEFAIEASAFKENTELAYAAVQGSAEAGAEAFAEIDRAARLAHLPVEKAHEFAQTLMLQGVKDTGLIARTIGAEAALIRTGQLEGAARLKSIIERSAVVGHFDAGRGKGAARRLAGLGLGPEIAKELASGKLSLEDGLEKLDAAIQAGPIGRAAAKKFGIEDFKTDVVNAFSSIARVDLSKFNSALEETDKYIQSITADGAPLHGVFQNLVDDAAAVVREFKQIASVAIDLSQDFGNLGNAFGDAFSAKNVSGAISGLEVGIIYMTGIVEEAAVGVEQLGASLAALGDIAIEGPSKAFANLKTTLAQLKGEYDRDASRRQGLIDRILNGTQGQPGDVGSAPVVKRAAAHVDAVIAQADKLKHIKPYGIEDLLFKPDSGRVNPLATAADLLNDRQSGGFTANFSSGFDVPSATAPIRAAAAPKEAASSSSGPAASSGARTISLTWYGDLIADGAKDEGHMRTIAEHEFQSVLERFATELAGAG